MKKSVKNPFLYAVFFIIVCVIVFNYFINKPLTDCRDCNLILISVDTLRPDHMGVYGYEKNTTPNIDKWAKDAFVFTNMRTAVPFTYPSFAELMTGVSPFESKIFYNMEIENDNTTFKVTPIDEKTPTLAQTLKKNGYTTGAFIQHAALTSYTNINKGFDTYIVRTKESDREKNEQIHYKSGDIANGSMKWLSKNKDKKLFLWVHLIEPHPPYRPVQKYKCAFGKDYCDEISQTGLIELENERNYFSACQPSPLPQNKTELFKTLYDGGIASSDDLVGQILSQIKKLDLDKKTIVVLYGDHGEGFDHQYYFQHGFELYDSNVKIPLIIKLPLSNYAPSQIPTNLQNTQISSTLLNLLKIQPPSGNLSKNSFVASFLNKKIENDQYLYFVDIFFKKFAVQHGQYKYIYSNSPDCATFSGKIQNEELYDLQSDPKETKNLINDKVELAKNLKQKLVDYLKTYNLSLYQMGFLPKPIKTSEFDKSKLELLNEDLKSLGY